MNRKISTILFSMLVIIGFTSCSAIVKGLYGIKNPKVLNEEQILHYSKKFNIPATDTYVLDTSFFSFLSSLEMINHKLQIKNHSQPLQALYYNKAGYLQSFHVNCYAGGFPNLKWAKNERFSTFPPKQQAPIDSILSIDKQLEFLKPLSTTQKVNTQQYDYIVIVYWNRFMSRQSKRLIRIIQENCKLATNENNKIIYVNNDDCYTGSIKSIK